MIAKSEVWLHERVARGDSTAPFNPGVNGTIEYAVEYKPGLYALYDPISGLVLIPKLPDNFRRVVLLEIPTADVSRICALHDAMNEANRVADHIWRTVIPSQELQREVVVQEDMSVSSVA